MAESKTSPRRIEARVRVVRALEMRKRGATYAEIAERCGYNSPQAAAKAIRTELQRMPQEEREELRRLENTRLDQLLAAIWPKACIGDLGAVRAALEIAERRARLLGLDAPARVAQTDTDGRDIDAIELVRARLMRLMDTTASGAPAESNQPAGSGGAAI